MSEGAARVLLVGEGAFPEPSRAALRQQGYRIRAAAHTAGALAALATEPVELMLTGWNAPGLDGIELTRRVRADPSLTDLHVIVLAPLDPSKPAVRALEAGADDYLLEPFDPTQLLARVRVGLRAAELRASEARLRALVANVPAAIYRCAHDSDWTMELLSEEISHISGHPPTDFIGSACRTFASVIHPDDKEAVERGVSEATSAGRPFVLEYRIVRADGGVRCVLEHGQLVHGNDGRTWLDGAIFDITERKRAEEEARRGAAIRVLGDERARMARELHDVVAHGLSVVALMASGARAQLRSDVRRSEQALDAIATSSREALAEMRRLLDGLRQNDERRGDLDDQPRLSGLGGLAARVRAAGLPVELMVEGEPRLLAPDVDLSAYRIVQEALTNSLKHAGPARARVSVRYDPGGIEVEVTDDGRGGGENLGEEPAQLAGGYGLPGMRERVFAQGGELRAGPRADGGYRTWARLPERQAASA